MAGTLVDTNVLNQGVRLGMKALREQLGLARIVNSNKGDLLPQGTGKVVSISIPAAVTTITVTADVVQPSVTAITPTSIDVTVDQHKAAPFAISDVAAHQIGREIIPDQLSEAIKSISNTIDSYLWGLLHDGSGLYGYAGSAGTSPFGTDMSAFYDAVQVADDQLMPPEDRFMLINPKAKAQALQNRAVFDRSMGSDGNVAKGTIGEFGGADWIMSQNVPSHTAGTSNSAILTNATGTAGDTTIACDTGSGTLENGDIISFASHDQTYRVVSDVADVSSGTITFFPALVSAVTNSTAITLRATYRVNALIHRDCIAFSMASFSPAQTQAGRDQEAIAVDQESGLALRLRVSEQYYQTGYAFDALYGGKVARPEFGVILAG